MTHRQMALRTAAGTLALATCLGGGALALAGAAHATPTDSDRSIVVATGTQPYDAIAGGPLAAYAGAPILLQHPVDYLDPTIGYYLNRAKDQGAPVTHVYILGGDAAVSPTIADSLKRQGLKVDRIGGQDRYATALNIALETELIG